MIRLFGWLALLGRSQASKDGASRRVRTSDAAGENANPAAESMDHYVSADGPPESTLEQAVGSLHQTGTSQRTIARASLT
jgi:hypothetical protein